MKKSKKPSRAIKVTKRKINLRLAMIVGSVVLLVAVLVYGTLQKTFFTPKAAERTAYKLSRNNKICKDSFSSRTYAECPFSGFGNPCGTKYTFKGKVETKQTGVPCGTMTPSKVEKWRNNWLHLPEPQPYTLYCCASDF